MTTAAQKISRQQETSAKKNAAPIIKVGKKLLGEIPKAYGKLIAKAAALKEKEIILKAEIEAINQQLTEMAIPFMEKVGSGSCRIEYEQTEVRIITKEKVEIAKPARLNDLLGPEKFACLVRTRITYAPEQKLIDLAESDDIIAECLSIREGKPSITYKKL